MIDQEGYTFYDDATPQQLKRDISAKLAEGVNEQFALKERVDAGIGAQFQAVRDGYQKIMGTIADGIEATLACCCKTEQVINSRIQEFIESKLSVAQTMQSVLAAKIAKVERRLNKAAGKDKMPPADAEREEMEQGPRNPVPINNSSGFQPGGGSIPPPSFRPDPQPFGVPPDRQQITNLYFVLEGGGDPLPLEALPDDWWQHQNSNGFWISTEPTIATRGSVPVYSPQGEQLQPQAMIFFNSSQPFSETEIASLMQSIGLAPQGVSILTLPQAWDVATRDFPATLVGQAWDAWDLPHPPAVQTTLGPITPSGQNQPINPPGTPENGTFPPSEPLQGPASPFEAPEGVNAMPAFPPNAQNGQLFTNLPLGAFGQGAGAAAQIGVNQAAGLVQLLAGITHQSYCRATAPIARTIGLPPDLFPGCATIHDIAEAFSRMIRNRIGET